MNDVQQRQLSRGKAYALILASVLLLTLAAAPFSQFYLAWFALAPWLIAVGQAPTMRAAFVRGWLAGIIYFALNEWWLWTATIPGTIGVIVCSGFFWGLAAALIYYFRLLPASDSCESTPHTNQAPDQPAGILVRVFGIAVVWVETEWLRCNTVSEFPWLPLGSTQSPVVVMCQIADVAGIWGVSFWVMLVNALVATAWLHRRAGRRLWAPSIVTAVLLLVIAGYGAWRLYTTPEIPGPQIMLLQSNHPHVRGGASTTTPERAAEFFLIELENQLSKQHADLVILPENEFPPLNDEARAALAPSPVGPFLESTYQRLRAIAKEHNTAILVGGAAVTGWGTQGKAHTGSEIRNSAYLFEPKSEQLKRYDKIRLVPYSERLPNIYGPRWLKDALLLLAAGRAVQPLQAGRFEDLQPFTLTFSLPATAPDASIVNHDQGTASSSAQRQASFVTPICLENIDPILSAQMARDPATGRKRADFFANLSNDGWFSNQEKHQHLQLLVFRCIENRVPMARCSNTGISAFIDSCGRILHATAIDKPDVATRQLLLDERETFYMAHTDVVPLACLAVLVVAAAARLVTSANRRSATSTRVPSATTARPPQSE